MSDDDCDYADDISIPDSVGSCFEQVRDEEEKQKKNINKRQEVVEEEDKDVMVNRLEVYEKFKFCVFQDASNDKLYMLRIKKSQSD
tara:strand:- start:322 stop:579 length:258 start_codon:yes stop_codon:yes gene_type:complete